MVSFSGATSKDILLYVFISGFVNTTRIDLPFLREIKQRLSISVTNQVYVTQIIEIVGANIYGNIV